jgi:hypothetical protein
MIDLSSYIKKYRFMFYQTAGPENGTCKYYIGSDQCDRKNGCYCRKLAEIKGNIDYVIPSEYRDLTIENAHGVITDREGKRHEVWGSVENQAKIHKILREYLFGNAESSYSLKSREEYNSASRLDFRYNQGANLIIHGIPKRYKKSGLPSRPMPTGKTLIGCLVLKEAIWRRLYPTNRADTYSLVSYQTLKQDLKIRSERATDLKECDWLAIDDISLPVNENDFSHQNFISLFDDFLMSRMESKLPTILMCDFDVLSRNYTSIIGYSFQKMVTAKNTWLISVGESNGDN